MYYKYMDIIDVNVIWDKVKAELEENLPEHVYNNWVTPLAAVDCENDTLVLYSPHSMAVDILKKSWYNIIKACVKKVLGENATCSLSYDPEYAKSYIKTQKEELKKQKAGQTKEERSVEDAKAALAKMQSSANLNLNLKFENFVVGDNSKFAYNIAYTVANNPSKQFNPLFIYGSSGLGKTHLLQAIGHYIIFNRPDLTVRYVRMEEYFNEMMRCYKLNETPGAKKKQYCDNAAMRKFHQKFSNVDILLMDDIQFLESKLKTMEDFFSTFEALYTNNKQIVIASDREPKDIPKLDKRLRTRFEMGIVVDILPPDFKTRYEIVKAYAKELDIEAEDDVFKLIAENFDNNVRELKGAFNKVSAFASFSDIGLITVDLARQVLKNSIKKNELTIDIVAGVVSDYFGVTVKDLKSTARQQKISNARQVTAYLSREVLSLSYEAIADYLEKKHTTILYSCETVGEKIKVNSDFANTIQDIRAKIKK